MLDLRSNFLAVFANEMAISGNATTTGTAIVDTKGYRSVTFLSWLHNFTDGAFEMAIQDGDDSGLSDAAAVVDEGLIGTEANNKLDADRELRSLAYVGGKRYVRCNIVSTGVTTGADVFTCVLLGHPEDAPTAQGGTD